MHTITSSVTTGEHWSVRRAHRPPAVSLSAFIIHRKVLIMSNCRSPEVNRWPESCWTDSLDFLYTCFRVLEPISLRPRLERNNSDTFVPDKKKSSLNKVKKRLQRVRSASVLALHCSFPHLWGFLILFLLPWQATAARDGRVMLKTYVWLDWFLKLQEVNRQAVWITQRKHIYLCLSNWSRTLVMFIKCNFNEWLPWNGCSPSVHKNERCLLLHDAHAESWKLIQTLELMGWSYPEGEIRPQTQNMW